MKIKCKLDTALRQGQAYEGNKTISVEEVSTDYMLHGMGSCRELGKCVQGRRHIAGITQGTKELDEFSGNKIMVILLSTVCLLIYTTFPTFIFLVFFVEHG